MGLNVRDLQDKRNFHKQLYGFIENIYSLQNTQGCSPGRCIPLLGRHRETPSSLEYCWKTLPSVALKLVKIAPYSPGTLAILANAHCRQWECEPPGSAFMLERTRKHDLEGNGLPNRA